MGSWTDDEIQTGLRVPERRQRACRELHLRYAGRLLGFLARMCRGDRDLAEDLLGHVLYKACLGLAAMETPCRSLRAWLYTVAARTALDELSRGAEPAGALVPLTEELADRLPARSCAQPEGDACLDDAVEAVLARLDVENPRYRTLLEMEHVGLCDRGEIAAATGIPRKQIAQYLKRARTRFAQMAREHPVLAAYEQASARGEAA